MRKRLVGRKVHCHLCSRKTVSGTTRVCRKLIFHFCAGCWLRRQVESIQLMVKAAA